MIRMAIVEDEQQYAKQLREYVDRFSQQLGESFDVTEYSDGDGLVEGFHAQFDIILMDVEMPFLDGMTGSGADPENRPPGGYHFYYQYGPVCHSGIRCGRAGLCAKASELFCV